MRTYGNEILRRGIGWALVAGGILLHIAFLLRVAFYARTQRRLLRKYKIDPLTIVQAYGRDVQTRILAQNQGAGGRLAQTSGTTAEPKQMLYTRSRLRRTAMQFVDVFARGYVFMRPARKSLFIFSSPERDSSLTSFLLNEARPPSLLASLQAPYRLLQTKEFQSLTSTYGLDAVRFFILVLTNPGVIYSTNPSTLYAFFANLELDWKSGTRLVREFHATPHHFTADLRRTARRVSSAGYRGRMGKIANSSTFIPLTETVPGITHYSCWTGGYVAPFLRKLATYLPAPRYVLWPMYSLSTETVETISDFSQSDAAFLPMGLGVAYEFIEDGRSDHPANLLLPSQLEPGKIYSMVVSDDYGLKRYQTGDLFLCDNFHRGLPNLRFLRRRNLEYSFSGEKITSLQLNEVFDRLRKPGRELSTDDFLTCIPSSPAQGMPHYKLIVISDRSLKTDQLDALAERAESYLAGDNFEYRGKVASWRLQPLKCLQISMEELAQRMGEADSTRWQSQFKVLPLYQRLWESNEP